MSERVITTRVELDGEAQFIKGMAGVNSSLSVQRSALAAVTAEYGGNANSMAALTAKQSILKQQQTLQVEKVKMLEQAVKDSSSAYGENSKEADKYRTQLNYAKRDLSKLNTELDQNDKYLDEASASTDGCATSIDNYGKKVKQAADNSDEFGEKGASSMENVATALASSKLAEKAAELVRYFAQLASGAAAFADNVITLATQTGIGTDELQGYMYAAELVDVSTETLTKSMAKQIKSMGSAADGTKQYSDAYSTLGISVTDTDDHLRDSQTVYWEVIDALGNMTNETERDEIAMALLGRSAQELNPLIAAGAEQMNAFASEAQSVGYVLNNETLNALGELDDQIQRLKLQSEATKNSIGAALAPALEEVAEVGTDVLSVISKISEENPALVRSLALTATGIAGVTAAVVAFKAVSAGLAAIGLTLGPIAAIGTVIAAVSAIIVSSTQDIDEQVAKLVPSTESLDEAQANLDRLRAEYEELYTLVPDAVVGSEAETFRQAIAAAKEQVESLTSAQSLNAQATITMEERQAALASAMDDFNVKANELATEYERAYTAAYNSIGGQTTLFGTLAAEVGISVNDMIVGLESQIAYMDTYAVNMQRAAEMGISEGLLKELADGSVESAAYLQSIVDAGEEKVADLNAAFSKVETGKDQFATLVEEMEVNTREKLDDLVKETAEKIGEMNMDEDAYTAAKSTIDGYLEGIEDKSGTLYDRMSELAAGAMASFNLALVSGTRPTGIGMKYTDTVINGSHAAGLDRVPFDGYIAELHRNEMILDAVAAGRYRARSNGYENVQQQPQQVTQPQPLVIKLTAISELDGREVAKSSYDYLVEEGELRGPTLT